MSGASIRRTEIRADYCLLNKAMSDVQQRTRFSGLRREQPNSLFNTSLDFVRR